MAPANDNFANRILITDSNFSITGDNTGATLESGEPSYGYLSVWYEWVAPSTWASYELNTIGTTGFDDTKLAVYTGTAVNALTLVQRNDDRSEDYLSQLFFATTSGTSYKIAVTGYNSGDYGSFVLNGIGLEVIITVDASALAGGFSLGSSEALPDIASVSSLGSGISLITPLVIPDIADVPAFSLGVHQTNTTYDPLKISISPTTSKANASVSMNQTIDETIDMSSPWNKNRLERKTTVNKPFIFSKKSGAEPFIFKNRENTNPVIFHLRMSLITILRFLRIKINKNIRNTVTNLFLILWIGQNRIQTLTTLVTSKVTGFITIARSIAMTKTLTTENDDDETAEGISPQAIKSTEPVTINNSTDNTSTLSTSFTTVRS